MLFAKGDPRRFDYEEPEPITTDVRQLVQTRDTMLRLPGRLIALVGDLSREEASRLCAGLLPPLVSFSASPDPQEALTPRYLAPAGGLRDTALTLPKLTQVYFHYSRLGLVMTDPDFARLLVADTVLGGSSPLARLYAALRVAGGDTYTPYTTLAMSLQPEIYSLVAYTRTTNAEPTERKLREVLRRLHQDGLTPEEHSDAVKHLVGTHKRIYQQPNERLRLALWEWSHGLPPGFYDRLIESVNASTLTATNQFIRRFYDPARFALFKVGPPR